MDQSGITLNPAPFFPCFTYPTPCVNRNISIRNQFLEAKMYREVMDARVSGARRIRVHGLGTIPTFGLARPNSTRTRATLGETVL
jgi:hypothetical protein